MVNTIAGGGLTQVEFEVFREFFYRQTGIRFEDTKRYFVDRRVLGCIHAAGMRSFRDYMAYLRHGASKGEMQTLVNALTVNETYFYRDDSQFKVLISHILPQIVKRTSPSQTIRIWSSPCSTGEEAYTIALHLLDLWADIDRYDVEIVGTDIDTEALEAARLGIYGPRSIQHVPPALLSRYFKRLPGDQCQICNELRSTVRFERVNIIDPLDTKAFRGFDVIFSRNMLIYFDDASRRLAADAFYDSLRPGGYVCLAASESMTRISPLFKAQTFSSTTVYQRPL